MKKLFALFSFVALIGLAIFYSPPEQKFTADHHSGIGVSVDQTITAPVAVVADNNYLVQNFIAEESLETSRKLPGKLITFKPYEKDRHGSLKRKSIPIIVNSHRVSFSNC